MNCNGNILTLFLFVSILIGAILGRSIKQDSKFYLIETDTANKDKDTASKVKLENKGEDYQNLQHWKNQLELWKLKRELAKLEKRLRDWQG